MIYRIFRYFFPKPKTNSEIVAELVKSIKPEDLIRGKYPIDSIEFGNFHKAVVLEVEHGISFEGKNDK